MDRRADDVPSAEMLMHGTHGDFYAVNGQPIQEGYEFPPRNP
jgi:hypothetical protein